MVRRYRAVGGMFALRIPIVAATLLAASAWAADWTVMVFVAAAALVASSIERGLVIEVTPQGLSRQLRIGCTSVRACPVVPWAVADQILTRWSRPRDFSALETIVTGGGSSVRFTSRMGYRAYHALVSDIANRAPDALRQGLTDQVLREPPDYMPRRLASSNAAWAASRNQSGSSGR